MMTRQAAAGLVACGPCAGSGYGAPPRNGRPVCAQCGGAGRLAGSAPPAPAPRPREATPAARVEAGQQLALML